MPTEYKERSFPFLLISLIAHLAMFSVMPLAGYPQIGKPWGTGGPLEVTMLSSSASSASIAQTVVTARPPVQPAKPAPTVKSATTKVLTTSNPTAPKQPAPTTPSTTVAQQVVEPSSAQTGIQTGTGSGADSSIAQIPYGSDVVSIISTPNFFKEAVSLTSTVTVRMAVSVAANGAWKSTKIVQSNGTAVVNDYAIRATERFLKYDSQAKDYEVTVVLIVNPDKRTTDWNFPDDKVRFATDAKPTIV